MTAIEETKNLFKKAGLEKFSLMDLQGKTLKISLKQKQEQKKEDVWVGDVLGDFSLCSGIVGVHTDGSKNIVLSINKTYVKYRDEIDTYVEKLCFNIEQGWNVYIEKGFHFSCIVELVR